METLTPEQLINLKKSPLVWPLLLSPCYRDNNGVPYFLWPPSGSDLSDKFHALAGMRLIELVERPPDDAPTMNGLARVTQLGMTLLAVIAAAAEPGKPTDGELLDALDEYIKQPGSPIIQGSTLMSDGPDNGTVEVRLHPRPEWVAPENIPVFPTIADAARAIIAAQRGGEVVTISREELGKQPEEQAARREALKPHLTQFQGRDVLHDAAQRGGKE